MQPRVKQALLWLFTIALLGGCVYALYATGFFESLHSKQAMEAYIAKFSPWSHLMYFLIQLVSVIIAPIPSNITALVGAVMFGFLPAFLLTWGAVVLGSVIVFLLARGLGQKFVHQFVGQKVSDKYLEVIQRKRDVFLFLAFLFPFFPDDLLCILAGLTDLSLKRFLVLCLVARPWGLLVACGVGGSALTIPPWGMALIGLVGLALFVVALRYGDQVEEAMLQRMKKS